MRIWKHRITITKSDRRDFFILIVASLLNFSFAAEKAFIVLWHQQPDTVWLAMYWGMWILLTYLAVADFIHDEIEEEEHSNTNILI